VLGGEGRSQSQGVSWGPNGPRVLNVWPPTTRSKAACSSAALVIGKFRTYQTFIWIVANAKESFFLYKLFFKKNYRAFLRATRIKLSNLHIIGHVHGEHKSLTYMHVPSRPKSLSVRPLRKQKACEARVECKPPKPNLVIVLSLVWAFTWCKKSCHLPKK
jgi:hypothetical protein